MPINGGRFIIPLLRNSRSMLNLHGTLCEKKKVCSLSPHLHKKPEKCFHPPLNPHKISNHKDTIMGPKKSSYMNKNEKFNLMRSEKKKKCKLLHKQRLQANDNEVRRKAFTQAKIKSLI